MSVSSRTIEWLNLRGKRSALSFHIELCTNTVRRCRFVAFVSGSFASVLVLFSLLDPDAFLHFEITPDRTVLFYIGIFGSLMAIARGMVPDDHRVVDPDALMREVIEETHYMPVHWRGNLHSADVS